MLLTRREQREQPECQVAPSVPCCDAPPNVFGIGDRFQMIRVDARSHSAEMVEHETLRHRTVGCFPRGLMGSDGCLLAPLVRDGHLAVPVGVKAELPNMTWRVVPHVLCSIGRDFRSPLMAGNVSEWLPDHGPVSGVRFRGDWDGLPASAHAQPGRVDPFSGSAPTQPATYPAPLSETVFLRERLSAIWAESRRKAPNVVAVSEDEPQRLPPNFAPRTVRLSRNRGGLAAAAHTEARWIRSLSGRLSGSHRLSSLTGRSVWPGRGRFAVAARRFVAQILPDLPQTEAAGGAA